MSLQQHLATTAKASRAVLQHSSVSSATAHSNSNTITSNTTSSLRSGSPLPVSPSDHSALPSSIPTLPTMYLRRVQHHLRALQPSGSLRRPFNFAPNLTAGYPTFVNPSTNRFATKMVTRIRKLHSQALRAGANAVPATATATATPVPTAGSIPLPPARFVVYYGSQTGTAMSFAHQLAKMLRKVTDRNGQKASVQVVDLATFSPHEFRRGGAHIFLTACFGSGEPTENARNFHSWLMSPAPEQEKIFTNVPFCFFGLGQSRSYPERYQRVTKEMDARLGELGGLRVLPRAEGDSAVDVEADFEHWSGDVMKLVDAMKAEDHDWRLVMAPPSLEKLDVEGAPADSIPVTATATPATTEPAAPAKPVSAPTPAAPCSTDACATTAANVSAAAAAAVAAGLTVPDARHPVLVPIIRHQTFSPFEFSPYSSSNSPVAFAREATFLEMDISGHALSYKSGDYVGIYPCNTDEMIQKFLDRLGVRPDLMIDMSRHKELFEQCPQLRLRMGGAITPSDEKRGMVCVTDVTKAAASSSNSTDECPSHIPLDSILRWGIDLLAIPRRNVLKEMAALATDPIESRKLQFLGDTASGNLGRNDYNSWVVGEQRNVIDIMNAFHSIQLKEAGRDSTGRTQFGIDELLDLLPPLSCRFYSIASSPVSSPGRLAVLSSRVVYLAAANYQPRTGLSSSMLWNAHVGDKMSIFIKPSLFHMPTDITKPIIMVAAGAGVAPFRAFILERYQQRRAALADTTGKTPVPGPAIIVVGIEARKEDYWFGEEMERLASEEGEQFLNVIPAFSHEQPWRVYAPYKMVEPETGVKIWKLLEKGASIYVCGSATRLAPPVNDALCSILARHGQPLGITNEKEAANHLKLMQQAGTYQLDAF